MIKNLAALGKTVLLTTHYMDEAQYLADRVAVIAGGRIVAEGDSGDARPAGTRPGRRSATGCPTGPAPPADLGGPPAADGFVEFAPDDLTARAAPADRLGASSTASASTTCRSSGPRWRTSTCS